MLVLSIITWFVFSIPRMKKTENAASACTGG
jgi:hypothetical protein